MFTFTYVRVFTTINQAVVALMKICGTPMPNNIVTDKGLILNGGHNVYHLSIHPEALLFFLKQEGRCYKANTCVYSGY